MKRVSAEEFAEHAAEYLAGEEQLEVECDGRTLGYYRPIPVRARELTVRRGPKPGAKEAREQLERTIQRVLDETGLTEDELADLFDPNKPLPDGPIGRAKKPA